LRPRCSRSCYQSVLIGFWSWGRGVLGLVTNRFWLAFWVLRPSSSWSCYQSFFIGFRVETEVFSVLLPIVFYWVLKLRPRSSRPYYQSLLIGFSSWGQGVLGLATNRFWLGFQLSSWGRGVLDLATNHFWLGFGVEAEEFSCLLPIAFDWVFELRPRSSRPCDWSLLIGFLSWGQGVIGLATNRFWLGFRVEAEEFSSLLPIALDWVLELRSRSSHACYQSLLIGFSSWGRGVLSPVTNRSWLGFWGRGVLNLATNRFWLGFWVEVEKFSSLLPIALDWVFELRLMSSRLCYQSVLIGFSSFAYSCFIRYVCSLQNNWMISLKYSLVKTFLAKTLVRE